MILAASVLAAWEGVLRAELINPTFVASPSQIWQELAEQMSEDFQILHHTLATLEVAAIGLVLGSSFGMLAGFSLGIFPRFSEVVDPFIIAFNSMPRFALAPLFLLWFGIGGVSHIALVFTLSAVVVLTNTLAGARSVDREYLTLARLLGARRSEIIFKITMPSTIPWIVAGVRLSVSYSLAGAIVAQMFSGQEGLGFLIAAGSGSFNIPQVFASLFIIIVLAGIVDTLATHIERRLLKWRLPT